MVKEESKLLSETTTMSRLKTFHDEIMFVQGTPPFVNTTTTIMKF